MGMVQDPIEIFRQLYEQAARSCAEPDATVLSTVDPDGRPSGRYVLLKAVDRRGFVFYTNMESRKARALDANPTHRSAFIGRRSTSRSVLKAAWSVSRTSKR